MKRIRCNECGRIIAQQNDQGTITVLCKGKKKDGQRCNTENVMAYNEVIENVEKNQTH